MSRGTAAVPSGGRGAPSQGRARLLAQPPQNIANPGPSIPSGRAEQARPPAGLPALNLHLPEVALANPDLWSRFPRQSGFFCLLVTISRVCFCREVIFFKQL